MTIQAECIVSRICFFTVLAACVTLGSLSSIGDIGGSSDLFQGGWSVSTAQPCRQSPVLKPTLATSAGVSGMGSLERRHLRATSAMLKPAADLTSRVHCPIGDGFMF